jgi:hypothetical protein
MKRCFLWLLVFLICDHSQGQSSFTTRTLFDSMMKKLSETKSCTYVLNTTERVFGQMMHSEYIVKVNAAPYRVYVYSITPNPGAEALFLEHENNDKILINPNRFPFINVSLSSNSMLLRKKHQYSIREMGFAYLYEMFRKNAEMHGERFYKTLTMKEDVTYKNKSYHVIEVNNNEFDFINYTVQNNENVSSIAKKHLVNDHMILELNSNISDYDDVKPGDIIKIPNSFAKRIVLYIDKTYHLPLIQLIYDNKGLYSEIEFSSYVNNPVFQLNEFSRDFPRYKF